jgi:hypothetical protein
VAPCIFSHYIASGSQYHSIQVSITRHSPENLYNNTNPYKLLWTGEKRNFIEQDPNTGVYHKTAHYYDTPSTPPKTSKARLALLPGGLVFITVSQNHSFFLSGVTCLQISRVSSLYRRAT